CPASIGIVVRLSVGGHGKLCVAAVSVSDPGLRDARPLGGVYHRKRRSVDHGKRALCVSGDEEHVARRLARSTRVAQALKEPELSVACQKAGIEEERRFVHLEELRFDGGGGAFGEAPQITAVPAVGGRG